MIYKIVLHENVVQKLENAAQWYEEQQKGLGEDFAFEFEVLSEYIGQIPFGFPKAFGNYRRVMFRRFPFIILYKIESDVIEISNLIHAKQKVSKRKPN